MSVKRWDLVSGKCTATFKHPDWVKCFALAGNYLITGSRDENIRVWDLSVRCLFSIVGFNVA
jgi:WD40 repeat protein